MRLKQIINLLWITLFLGAFQTTIIHSKHQSLDTLCECKVCELTKQNKPISHHTIQSFILENIEIARDTKKQVRACAPLKRGFVYEVLAHTTPVKIFQIQKHDFQTVPLGYDATAPPLFS